MADPIEESTSMEGVGAGGSEELRMTVEFANGPEIGEAAESGQAQHTDNAEETQQKENGNNSKNIDELLKIERRIWEQFLKSLKKKEEKQKGELGEDNAQSMSFVVPVVDDSEQNKGPGKSLKKGVIIRPVPTAKPYAKKFSITGNPSSEPQVINEMVELAKKAAEAAEAGGIKAKFELTGGSLPHLKELTGKLQQNPNIELKVNEDLSKRIQESAKGENKENKEAAIYLKNHLSSEQKNETNGLLQQRLQGVTNEYKPQPSLSPSDKNHADKYMEEIERQRKKMEDIGNKKAEDEKAKPVGFAEIAPSEQKSALFGVSPDEDPNHPDSKSKAKGKAQDPKRTPFSNPFDTSSGPTPPTSVE